MAFRAKNLLAHAPARWMPVRRDQTSGERRDCRGLRRALVRTAALACVVAGVQASTLRAEPLALAPSGAAASSIFAPVLRDEPSTVDPDALATQAQLAPHLRRQMVSAPTGYAAGTIVIDTANTYLYLVLGSGKALRYGIGVGREGFTWSGVETISRMAEWPDWFPPAEMISRQPYLPRFMAGGPGNPLGARALYLGHSQYRIHGTNDPSTIGRQVSSGCIRMTNADVTDLYGRVRLGATVVVLPGGRTARRDAPVHGDVRPIAATRATWRAGSSGVSGLY